MCVLSLKYRSFLSHPLYRCYSRSRTLEWLIVQVLHENQKLARHPFGVLFCGAKHLMAKRNRALHLNAMPYHCTEEFLEEPLPPEWHQKAFPKLMKLTQLLKNVDLIDGRLVNISDGSIIIDDRVEHRMLTFKSLARIFIGAPLVQKALKNNVAELSGGRIYKPLVCFGTPSEREPMIAKSLSTVGGFLNISAQQRQSVRVKISPLVAQVNNNFPVFVGTYLDAKS